MLSLFPHGNNMMYGWGLHILWVLYASIYNTTFTITCTVSCCVCGHLLYHKGHSEWPGVVHWPIHGYTTHTYIRREGQLFCIVNQLPYPPNTAGHFAAVQRSKLLYNSYTNCISVLFHCVCFLYYKCVTAAEMRSVCILKLTFSFGPGKGSADLEMTRE